MAIPETRDLSYAGANLPQVTKADDGMVLGVVDGSWKLKADKDSELPVPTAADVGKAPLANANGGYTLTDLGPGISYEVVSELPSTGEAGVIYLVANGGSGTNIYDEYIWTGSAYEKIGTTETPNNVLIIPNISFADEDAEATAALAMQGVNAGKMVVGTKTIDAMIVYFYLTFSYPNYSSEITFIGAPLTGAANPSLQLAMYSYDPQEKKFVYSIRDVVFQNALPRAIADNIDETQFNYVYEQSSTASGAHYKNLFAKKELPLTDNNGDKVLAVPHGGGAWGARAIKKAEVEISSLAQNIQPIVAMAEQAGTATAYLPNVLGAFGIIHNVRQNIDSVTGVLPVITSGDLRFETLTATDSAVALMGTFFDSANSKFVKVFINAQIEGEGEQEAGYVVIHCEAYTATLASA